jgi:succinate dehydrogenase hydrophobic anchor subunit
MLFNTALPSDLDILYPILYRNDIWEEKGVKIQEESRRIDASLISILERLPVLSCYAKTRGWHYVISWLHRLTGIGLIIIVMVHLYILSSWQTPNLFITDIEIPLRPIFLFLTWASSLVVGFHALNGSRLILYELFGRRDDPNMIRWIFGLSAAYAAMVGLMMAMKNQRVSSFFFWLMAFFSGAIAAYVVASRVWEKRHSVLWKLQRISGGFLFITVPAYLLFSFLNPGETNGAEEAIVQMQNLFNRLVILTLSILTLYHAGYGLFSIVADYTSSRTVRTGMTAFIGVVIAVLAVLAFRLILSV